MSLIIIGGLLLTLQSAAAQLRIGDAVDPEEVLEEELRAPYYAVEDGGPKRAQRPIVDRIPMRGVMDRGGSALVDVIYTRRTGQILTDMDGHALYATDRDTAYGVSSLSGEALKQWRPLTVSKDLRTYGLWGKAWNEALQVWVLTMADKPLYTFVGDKEPGVANGVGNGWYTMEVIS
ncbi:MAG: hypothetical protein P1U65_02655 [Minwuia sp.]|nr:hypothetical protein [Minwuia sp.]